MDITIYQINMGRDHNRIAFEGLDLLKMYQGSDKIDSRIYDRVFEGEVDCKDLEDVYRKFNLEHPEGYKGRSLSVSDVVEIVDENGDSTFHFCDSIGFKQIDFDPYLTEEYKEDKIKVVLCEPGKVARVAEISNTLAGLQKTVKGDIEQFCPYEEAVAIICNEEGKFNGMMPNRAIYSEPQEVEMSYGELTSRFREAERNGGEHLTGYIVFTEDSFTKPYPEAARTYAVSSNNKAFQPNMGGYSIYASALDGSDPMIRLEGYMQSEKGGKDGWKIDRDLYQLGVDTGDPGCLLIAADRQNVPSETCLVQYEPSEQKNSDQNNDGNGDLTEITAADGLVLFAQIEDRLAVVIEHNDAAQDRVCAEGHNERWHMTVCDADAVDQTDQCADPQRHQYRDDQGVFAGMSKVARDDSCQADDTAHGQVDIAGDDNEGHADGNDAVVGNLAEHIDDILFRQEAGGRDGQDHTEHCKKNEDYVFAELSANFFG